MTDLQRKGMRKKWLLRTGCHYGSMGTRCGRSASIGRNAGAVGSVPPLHPNHFPRALSGIDQVNTLTIRMPTDTSTKASRASIWNST